MSEKIIPIPARLKNVSRGGHVAGAEDIIDDNLGKTLDVINAESSEVVTDAVRKEDVVNNLDTTVPGKVLDARVGATLNASLNNWAQTVQLERGIAINTATPYVLKFQTTNDPEDTLNLSVLGTVLNLQGTEITE